MKWSYGKPLGDPSRRWPNVPSVPMLRGSVQQLRWPNDDSLVPKLDYDLFAPFLLT